MCCIRQWIEYPLELRHLISLSESSRLVTLGVCRHLDDVEASWFGDLLKEGCEKTGAFVSGLVLTISGAEEEQPQWIEVLVRFGTGPSGWTYLGGVGSSCGAGPTWLGLTQRGLGETGKSPITTVKHHRVIVV